MKKFCKSMAVALLMLTLLLSFSGCSGLEDMRQAQAFYQEDGDIIYKGSQYRLLPDSAYLSPPMSYDMENYVYVTEQDVPVLLSETLALETLVMSSDGNFLVSESGYSCYCWVGMYDSMCQRIQQGFDIEVICYSYGGYNGQTGEYTNEYYVLTEEQMATVEQVLSTVEPTIMASGWYLDYEWNVELEERSADMLFKRSSLSLSVCEGVYYLSRSTDAGELVYTVPQAYSDICGQILSTSIEAWESMDFGW